VSGLDPAKPVPIHDLVRVTSLMFALMLSFSAAGIWNGWVQARGVVQREALAPENALALADGLSPERAAKVKAGVIAYARGRRSMNGRRWHSRSTWTIRSMRSRTARS
jgi:hypothetical protein